MASTAVGWSLRTTQSTYSSAASVSARRRSLKTGRPGPLLTKRSGVIVTTRKSPKVRASLKWRMCPGCRTSKTPWHCTIFFPPARTCFRRSSTSAIVQIFAFASMSAFFRREVFEPVLGRVRDRLGRPHRRVAPVLDAGDDPLHALLEADRRRPAQEALDLGDVRERAVGLARPLGDVRLRAADELRQAVHRVGAAGADVEVLARHLAARRADDRVHDVRHEGEIARLGA